MDEILLHTCCAPCAAASIERLQERYKIIAFFYNPNIHPEDEYIHRKDEMIKVAEHFEVDLELGEYEKEKWHSITKGLEKEPEQGKRCEVCFKMRFEKGIWKSEELGIKKFTTTLSISPYKDFEKIKQIADSITLKHDIEFIPENFKKKNGYKRSVELSKSMDIYRQNYCGCVFSKPLIEQML